MELDHVNGTYVLDVKSVDAMAQHIFRYMLAQQIGEAHLMRQRAKYCSFLLCDVIISLFSNRDYSVLTFWRRVKEKIKTL